MRVLVMQGFPTLPIPGFVMDNLEVAANDQLAHQYTRSQGNLSLCESLVSFYSNSGSFGSLVKLDPMSDVLVTIGATEAIYAICQAFLSPGDEAVMIEPYFDSYPASVLLAGASPVFCSLVPSFSLHASDSTAKAKTGGTEWKLDLDALQAKITSKTKLLFLNNPQNPNGKVYTLAELEGIAEIARRHPNLIVVADEVYETLVYSDAPSKMIKFGMYKQTITIGSLGKMLGLTGWRVGWCIGPKELLEPVWMVRQNCSFSVPTLLQVAGARSIQDAVDQGFFEKSRKEYEGLRNRVAQVLAKADMEPLSAHGGYFLLARTGKIEPEKVLGDSDPRDYAVCKYLTQSAGVTPIPPSAFFNNIKMKENVAGRLARFAFCKDPGLLDAFEERMLRWKSK